MVINLINLIGKLYEQYTYFVLINKIGTLYEQYIYFILKNKIEALYEQYNYVLLIGLKIGCHIQTILLFITHSFLLF